jgi:ribulose-5-phosphate 4-epimerase/fuculose-1-phosphate aldolase
MRTEDEIIEQQEYVAGLERACKEWAETSQRNYQRAKRYFEALEKIAQTQYGLQSIMEDYPDTDSVEYLEAALKYYTRLTNSYQKTAREAIEDD